MPHLLFTIGHSNRTLDEFVGLLRKNGIEKVVDIRTIPRSRHNPRFNKDDLRRSLKDRRIGYRHLKKLGGLRHSKKDSVNLGWRNLSFRGFADHMATNEFKEGLNELKKIASKKKTAIMCAEALPWQCHRSLVADALTVQKWRVFHIIGPGKAYEHKLTKFLRVRKGKIVYPGK